MMKGFRIDRNDGRIYAMGVTAVSGGVHFSFPSKGETCAVILYRKGAKSPKGRIEFPVNARTGDVWSMTVLGDFSGLEYVYEVDGQQMPDPYGRKFTGMERWGSLARRTKPCPQPGIGIPFGPNMQLHVPVSPCITTPHEQQDIRL